MSAAELQVKALVVSGMTRGMTLPGAAAYVDRREVTMIDRVKGLEGRSKRKAMSVPKRQRIQGLDLTGNG
jgi:hypothetical protein